MGHSGGLHHDSPSALGQSEAVHREHRRPGSGGQGAGPGESPPTLHRTQHTHTQHNLTAVDTKHTTTQRVFVYLRRESDQWSVFNEVINKYLNTNTSFQ